MQVLSFTVGIQKLLGNQARMQCYKAVATGSLQCN